MTTDLPIDRAVEWLDRHITVTSETDIWTLALWAQHTWSLDVLPVSPRLLIDSIMPGSGKTTVLEHLQRLTLEPSQMAQVTSSALLVRLVAEKPRTLLLDEIDRALDPRKETTGDLLAILNSGYKRGATRPVLTPTKGGNWKPVEMPTYCAAAMAGNSPRIPDDTRSRSLRIFLLPDVNEEAEETDWLEETFELDALMIGDGLRQWAEDHADRIKEARPGFPDGCRGRLKERWVSFARLAQVLGGPWPNRVHALICRDMENERLDKEDGMSRIPPTMKAILAVAEILDGTDFLPTTEIVAEMIRTDPEMWGAESTYGRALTAQRLGKMLASAGLHSRKPPSGDRKRGYRRADVEGVAAKLNPSGSAGLAGLAGSIERSEGNRPEPPKVTGQTGRTAQTGRVCTVCNEPLKSSDPEVTTHPNCAEEVDDTCPNCGESLTETPGQSYFCAKDHRRAQRAAS